MGGSFPVPSQLDEHHHAVWRKSKQRAAQDATFVELQRPGAKVGPRLNYPLFSLLTMTCKTPKNATGKVLLTSLAGAGVGAVVGILLYSKRSMERRRQFRNYRTDQRLRLQGDWNLLKDKLQKAYTHLTDEDLAYVEGQGHELVSRLQAKLGKGKRKIVKMLNAL